MNGEGYEWMRENGRKFGWQYVYNHGPGSAHSNMLDQVQELHLS